MEFGELVQDVHTYDWLVFTSPNGVDAFFKMFYQLYSDAREIGGVRIAAVGPGTARKIKEMHLAVDLMPEKHFVAEGLVQAFKDHVSVENLKVLWVRGDDAREVLANELSGMGAIVDEAIAYRTVPEKDDNLEGLARLKEEGADVITFTSASTVEHFMNLGVPLPAETRVASIGPVTSAAIREHGLTVAIEAEENSIPGLVRAVRELLEVS